MTPKPMYNCRAEDATAEMRNMNGALDTVGKWMKSNRLKLNPDRTKFIWFGGRAQLKQINFETLSSEFGVPFEKTVVDLGVTLDSELSFSAHVGRLSRTCFYQLRQLRQFAEP